MVDFEHRHRQFEIGLEFVRGSFDKRNNFSKGSSEHTKDAKFECGGGSPTSFFNSNYLFH